MQVSSDIFIIGGGINGAGIAADAAGRGLSVCLCEQGDLASGTSSASSKLIHGGLRYLENYEFRLVRKAIQEREILLQKAPHLISPLEFILPYEKTMRPAWLIRLGLVLYDYLAAHPRLPNSKKIKLTEHLSGKSLAPTFKTGFSYYDCTTDDARLTILNVLAAKEHGATILPRTAFISAHQEHNQWQIQLKDLATGTLFYRTAKALINAAGPWIAEIKKYISPLCEEPLPIRLIKGSHIVVPKLYTGNFAYILQNSDKRVVFAIPFHNDFTLVGTTDVAFNQSLNEIHITPEEEIYLCNTINHYFKHSITQKDIKWSYAGVRCLQSDNAEKPSAVTRDYKIELATVNSLPLLTVISGKITTYRLLAEEAVEKLRAYFPELKPSWTATQPLPGGDFPNHDFALFSKAMHKQYSWLPTALLNRYLKSYGTRIFLFLNNTTCMDDLGEEFAGGLYQREVEYLIEHEWAQFSADILWRRTKLGLVFSTQDVEKLTAVIARLRSA
jgi:glycerol-3-phosphate dehydrogenase